MHSQPDIAMVSILKDMGVSVCTRGERRDGKREGGSQREREGGGEGGRENRTLYYVYSDCLDYLSCRIQV